MRYLLVGLGNIGEKRQGLLREQCVATVDPYRTEADYSSHLQVPADSYDAVVLATPNEVKLEYLSYFLSRGKHVLVEKPLLFSDAANARALRALAEQRGAVWYTSYNHRLEPLVMAVKHLLDKQTVGKVYRARLFYGNGTVLNNVDTWREGGYGVLEDLGCHLMDLADYLLGYQDPDFRLYQAATCEATCFDHCLFSTMDNKVTLECGWTTWKNAFSIDVFGSLGSVHLSGLCKWGQSELIVRKRVFPSGVPEETRQVITQPDATWERDLEDFECRVKAGHSSCAGDERISQALHSLAAQAHSLQGPLRNLGGC